MILLTLAVHPKLKGVVFPMGEKNWSMGVPSWHALMQGFDITPDLRRMCPSLTLQQIYKLSEHHHDDWITAVGDKSGTKTIVLLETLKRAVDSSGGMTTPPPASPMRRESADGVPQTPYTPGGGPNPYPSPGSVSSTHQFEDEDNLLLDSQVLPCFSAALCNI